MEANFEEILEDYLSTNLPAVGGEPHRYRAGRAVSSDAVCDYLLSSEPPDSRESLLQISEGLQKFTKFTSFRELATLTYGDQTSNCCIVSSIEFDRDGEFFAVAGVTKKIKVTCCLSVAQFTVCCYAVHRLLCIPSCA